MQRVPEPELMDEREQARAYAEADFSEPNERFVGYLHSEFPQFTPARVIDLGCGPGDISLRIAARHPAVEVDAVDGSAAMLAHGRAALAARPGLAGRVRFIEGVLPDADLPRAHYDTVVSNSLLHHLHRPEVLWDEVARLGAPGARVLVMDLFRPPTRAAAEDIVATYAGSEPAVLKRDFLQSLCAAFELSEVAAQLRAGGLAGLHVRTVSDRHLLVSGRLAA